MSNNLKVVGRLKSIAAVLLTTALVVPIFPSRAQSAPRASSLAINDMTVTEGNSGAVQAIFTVTMKGRATPATVGYHTTDGSATSPSDYEASSGTLQFSGGVKKARIAISVNGDALIEGNESFQVVLSDPTGSVTITDGMGLGSILNDDVAATMTINDATVGEGDTGMTPARFTASLSAPSATSVTVDYATGGGTATSASDYEATSGTVTFSPGETNKIIDANVIGDLVLEPDESFQVNLSNPVGASLIDASGLATIIDDEGAPAVSVNDASVQEGNGGTANLVFTVAMSHSPLGVATVGYETTDASATASDYSATSGTLTFNPGESSKTVTVPVSGDSVDEADETLNMMLLSPSNAVLADAQGLGTIVDDDATPSVSIADLTVTEGNSGDTPAPFVVSLSNPSSESVDVGFETDDATATAPGDYAAQSGGTVSIEAGQLQATIEVGVVGDTVNELDENYNVFLTSTTNATLSDGEGTGTIANDDRAPSTTSLKIRKGRESIKASGRLAPADRGNKMVVKLLKRRNGRYIKVVTKRPTLQRGIDTNDDGVMESKYSTRFNRPRSGRCRVVARFEGNTSHAPSTAKRTFDC